jgi:ElaA protein
MMKWILKKFEDLTLDELYAILQLRNEVFVVEQNCVYQDTDNLDQKAWHLMGWQENKLMAYTRILPPGIVYTEPAIGRVVISPAIRNTGWGKELMHQSLAACEKLFGNTSVTLNAQVYLKKFYESLEFETSGDPFSEDGIEHVKMTRKAPRKNP